MRRCDIDGLYKLTTANGWGMEKSYLECVFNTDPTGLIVVVTDEGEVIGMFKTTIHLYNLSRDVRKPVFGVSDQIRHKPGLRNY